MDVEDDVVYLHLKKGRNDVVLGLADYFGGWGFIAWMICRASGWSDANLSDN